MNLGRLSLVLWFMGGMFSISALIFVSSIMIIANIMNKEMEKENELNK